MKTTYGKITEAIEALGKLAKLDLRIAEAVKVSKLIAAVDSEMKTFNDVRLKLCEKYGKHNEGGSYEIPDESKKEFAEEISELLETEVELPGEEIKVQSQITIDAGSVLALAGLIDFEGDNNG